MKFNIGKKAVGMLSSVLVGTMLLSACSEGELAAKVNGEGISMEEYNGSLNMRKSIYTAQYGEEGLSQDIGDGTTIEDMLSKETIDSLVFDSVLLQDAKERKVKVADGDVEEKVKEFKTQFGGEEGYKKFLEENGIDKTFFESMVEENLIMEAHKKSVFEELKVSEDEIKDYFEQNKDYMSQAKASHILVETEEEAQAISKAIKEGESFESQVEKSTEPGAAERKGDLGYFSKGMMVPEFEEAAFSMKEGDISEPVKTEFGYHIIKLVDKKETLEDVKEDIENALKEEKYRSYLNELRENAEVEILLEEKPVEKSEEEVDSEKKETDSNENTEKENGSEDSSDIESENEQ